MTTPTRQARVIIEPMPGRFSQIALKQTENESVNRRLYMILPRDRGDLCLFVILCINYNKHHVLPKNIYLRLVTSI